MSAKPLLVRGAVLKCLFPFEENPHSPGPSPHYCLFVDDFLGVDGEHLMVVAYGTSKLDQQLQDAHCVLDVPTKLLSGSDIGSDQGVIHFLCDHLAIIQFESAWVYMNFSARLGVFKESQQKEPARRNLLHKFQEAETILNKSAIALVREFLAKKKLGLKPGSKLR